ncbi:MAG: hypothetical protein JW929_05345 [Anaerolineales bacterium]|nr:hypothetical protein [Anaerolineales bacterium]
MKTPETLRAIAFISAALLSGGCILEAAAPAGPPQVVVVTATPDGDGQNQTSADASATTTQEPAQTLMATFTSSLTATFTAEPVTMTAGQDLSCVKGPDWKLYEWVARIAEGETVTLIARAVPEIPDYYVARTGDGTECWAFGGSSTISGPAGTLPVRETPPLPTVTYVIENQVLITLCAVFIRGKEETAWGANRLSGVIIINGTFSVSILAGYYDVQINDCAMSTLYEEHDRAIGADPAYRYQLIANDVDFYIQNNHPFSICWIDILPPGGSWTKLYATEDGGGSILTGQRRDFTLRAGSYGIQATRCTSAVLPAAGLYVHPGMGGVTWA